MKELTPNTPVIVGIGFEQERSEDPTQCAEPWQLMVRAVRRAAADAGSETLLAEIESISVPQGMWLLAIFPATAMRSSTATDKSPTWAAWEALFVRPTGSTPVAR